MCKWWIAQKRFPTHTSTHTRQRVVLPKPANQQTNTHTYLGQVTELLNLVKDILAMILLNDLSEHGSHCSYIGSQMKVLVFRDGWSIVPTDQGWIGFKEGGSNTSEGQQ